MRAKPKANKICQKFFPGMGGRRGLLCDLEVKKARVTPTLVSFRS